VRSLAVILLALLAPTALLTVFNRSVTVVDLPATWVAAAAVLGGAVLTWTWRGERRGAAVVAASVALAAASAALSAQAMMFVNWRLARGAPAAITTVVERIEPHGLRQRDGSECAVVLQAWRSGAPPLRLALAGSTLLHEPASADAVLCRTAEASVLRSGERVALRVARGALGLDYLTSLDGHGVLTPPCSTCGTHQH